MKKKPGDCPAPQKGIESLRKDIHSLDRRLSGRMDGFDQRMDGLDRRIVQVRSELIERIDDTKNHLGTLMEDMSHKIDLLLES